MADYGRARGTDELGTSPGKSLLAVSLGALIIVPAVMSFFSTHKRITKAQAMTGQTPLSGWLSIILYVVFSPAWLAYMQSGTNSVWENTGSSAAPAAPAITEAAPAAEVAETAAESAEDQPSAYVVRDRPGLHSCGDRAFCLLGYGSSSHAIVSQ